MNEVKLQLIFSVFVAVLLTILPLPLWAAPYRPQWVVMVVLFWTVYYPNSIGAWALFLVGLILDGLQVSLLGEHGFALVSTFVLMQLFVKRFKFYSIVLQALIVATMVLVYQFILLGTEISIGNYQASPLFLASALSSMICWPWLTLLYRVDKF